ncbi:RICIN domain-containing protein [Ruminococcus sp.]|uniref:RICIN domain-containing protein n=1 Tax=Ruminococcus sp. TaxID=41978 RepID=UPI0025D3D4C2|nr:RICIN domain-containing protein [Ruminococcus sp.]MBQ6250280.1 RICIN domain-containing protein [Ruminococcus sp.]
MRKNIKRSLAAVAASVLALSGLPTAVSSINANAESYSMDELAKELEELGRLQDLAISDYYDQGEASFSVPAKLDVLIVKCSDVTMYDMPSNNHFILTQGSDTDRVIDHGVDRFKETVEEMTNYSLEINPTTVWVNDPLSVPKGGYGYDTIKDSISKPIPVEQYDCVFFFDAKQPSGYSVTGKNVISSGYGESYIIPIDVAGEIERLNRGASIEEERSQQWTCGWMTHEWIHQIDRTARDIVGDDRFPMCHDYQINGVTNFAALTQTVENGVTYLTNNYNGLKWKYEAGRYPDFIGDYYEALLSGEVIDTLDGNKKKGMTPAIWQFICSDVKLGTYTFKNTATNKYLYAGDENDDFGASALKTAANADLFSANTSWDLVYDYTSDVRGTCRLIPSKDKGQLMRAETSSNPRIRSAALYRYAWGAAPTPTKNFSFNIERDADGKYQIKSTLSTLDGYALRDNGNSGVEFSSTNSNNKWELTRVNAKNGVYYIKNLEKRGALTLKDNNSAADIQWFSKDNGNDRQAWTINEYDNGLYTISSAVSGTNRFFTASGSNLTLTGESSTLNNNQLWQLRKNASGFYTLVSKADPGRCIAWNESSKKLVLQSISGSRPQTWDIGQIVQTPAITDGYYYIKTSDNKYLSWNDSNYNVTKSTTPCMWKLTDKGNGYYWAETSTGNAIRFLDVLWSVNDEGTRIRICTDTNLCGDPEGASYAQHWAFVQNADGTFRIMPKLSFARGLRVEDTRAYLSSVPDNFTLIAA